MGAGVLYARSVLALLAALVPIAGSLYAGGSFLAGMFAVDHELRVRERIGPLVNERYESTLATAGRYMSVGVAIEAAMAERKRFERLLLDVNGICVPQPTYRDQYISQTMSAPLVPRAERRRQTVLLVTAVIGVILLALDQM